MHFYEFIFVTLIINSYRASFSSINAKENKTSSDFGGVAFLITFNNTSLDDYYVRLIPGDCPLTVETGGNFTEETCKCIIPSGQSGTIKLNAVTPESFTRDDKCWIYMYLRPHNRNNTKFFVKIIFHFFLLEGNRRTEMFIINCDSNDIYENETNSSRSFECDTITNKFRKRKSAIKKCFNISEISDTDNKYNTVVSTSLAAHSLVKRDVITTNGEEFVPLFSNDHKKDTILKTPFRTNETFSPTATTKEVCPQITKKHLKMKHRKLISRRHSKTLSLDKSFYKYFTQYIWITALLAAVTIIQCILIFTICIKRKCICFGEKPVISHFFRTYQDSVTTPLISTSIIDIENLKNHSASDSSTTIANMKCYKSCDKDKIENTKRSISDDILSKFINRRDWKNNYKNCNKNEQSKNENQDDQIAEVHSKRANIDGNISKENSLIESGEIIYKESTDKKYNLNLSVKEEQFHSFSCHNTQVDSESTIEQKNLPSIISKSSEKAAQTNMSKDSIDAILSERNIYLADENLSKYTLSSYYGKNKSTELVSKASKNITKYFNTLLHRRSRQSSQSEPGKDKDLKMLHMSEGSLYSSNDSE